MQQHRLGAFLYKKRKNSFFNQGYRSRKRLEQDKVQSTEFGPDGQGQESHPREYPGTNKQRVREISATGQAVATFAA